MIPERIGVNQASIFTGFCHTHDSSTFAPIDQPITSLTGEHIFLAAYRAVCRELFTKTAVSAEAVLNVSRKLDRGKNEAAQRVIQGFNHWRELGLKAGLRDLRREKSEYDHALIHKNHDRVSYYVVTLDHALPIACTIGFTPEVDFHGNRFQRLDNIGEPVDNMTCSILKTGTGAVIVFAWIFEKNGACSGLVNSIERLKLHQLPSAIVRLVFEYGENVFFSPSWWESLDDRARKTIDKHAHSFYDKPEGALRLDGSLKVLWSVVGRKKVIRSQS
ncbi:MAG: hypothetical protein ABL970_12635 [Nitrospira sp.]